jgi:cytochrome P450
VGDRYSKAVTIRRQYLETALLSAWPLVKYLPLRINRAYRQASQEIDTLLYQALDARRASAPPLPDLLVHLMQARHRDGTGLTDQEIRDEARTISIAGYETLAEALTWSLYLLALHPAEDQRLAEEVRAVCADRMPDAGDVPRLGFARRVLAEAMRLYPPTWLFVRVCRGPTVLPSGISLPRGAKLYLSQYVVHRQSRYFPDPERFNPERFRETAIQARPKCAYFPFGAGPRQCIGEGFSWMEGGLVLAGIVQRVRLALVPGQVIVPEASMTLRPKYGIRMVVHPRRS